MTSVGSREEVVGKNSEGFQAHTQHSLALGQGILRVDPLDSQES